MKWLAGLVLAMFAVACLADAESERKLAEVRKATVERCRDQMGEYGAALVKVCVDEDMKAYRALLKYEDRHKPIIDRCKRQMLAMGGWNIVKVCADQDIEAERALENY